MNDLTSRALALATDYPVFPCRADKRPACPHGFRDATRDPERIRALFSHPDAAHIGVPTGEASGLAVLDLDPRSGSDAWADISRLPITRTHATGSGGRHHVFRHQPGLRCSAGRVAPGVDVRAEGGYVVWWPCVYRPDVLADWPAWVQPAQPERQVPSASTALAAPTLAVLIETLNRLPNPATEGRDSYTRIMMGAAGAIHGLDCTEDQAEAAGAAAVAWANRWEGRAETDTDEACKWRTDWARQVPTVGWDVIERAAWRLIPSWRTEQACLEFGPGEPEPPDNWRRGLLLSDKRAMLPRLHNAMLLLRHGSPWRFEYDAFGNVILRDGVPISDPAIAEAAAWLETQGCAVSVGTAAQAMLAVANGAQVHPVRDYLDGLIWDRTPRIDSLLIDHFGAADTPLHRAMGARFLISMVARIRNPGCQVDTMLILEGRQGLRKSAGLKALAGAWFTDHMPDLTSKDAAIQLQGVWLTEFAELDKLNRAESSRAKAFITTASDRFRRPFGRVAEDFPRQCVFAGTVNPGSTGYLQDETGNRRYWPVTCGVGWDGTRQIDTAALRSQRNQLWAEAGVRFASGEAWWLDTAALEQMQAGAAADRYVEDAWAERIREVISTREQVTLDEVRVALGLTNDKWSQSAWQRVASTLRLEGWTRVQRRRAWHYVRSHGSNVVPLRPGTLQDLI